MGGEKWGNNGSAKSFEGDFEWEREEILDAKQNQARYC